MDFPVRVAFCKILFATNGGQFDDRGLPIINNRSRARGRCNKAYDCYECSFLQNWLVGLVAQGWVAGWECDKCLKDTKTIDASEGVERHVQGFYQSGRKYSHAPDDPEFDPDRPMLEGCTRCGWESSFLQLVLRRRACPAASVHRP